MTTQEEWAYYESARVASDTENYCDGRTPDYPRGFLVNGMTNPDVYAPADRTTITCSWVAVITTIVIMAGLVIFAYSVVTP